MAEPDKITPSSNPTTTSQTPTSKSLHAPIAKDRASAPKRIDEILETARRRSVALQSSKSPEAPMAESSRQSLQFSEHDGLPVEAESSADEQTSIVRRENNKLGDYHSVKNILKVKAAQSASRRSADRSQEPERTREEEDHKGWVKGQLAKLKSIELDNKGSVARDHLALERTFLAWLRTSLAFASIGIAITQLFRLNTSIDTGTDTSDQYANLHQVGKPLGATFLGISILVLFVGFHRYFESQHWVIKGKFPASRGSIALVSVIAFMLMVTSLVVVLVVQPTAFEK